MEQTVDQRFSGDDLSLQTTLVENNGDIQEHNEEYYIEDACLFIGDLARGVTEEQLKEPFEAYGAVKVEIKRDKTTNYSLGYGFAYFKSKEQASEAKRGLGKTMIGNRAVRLGWAQKNTNLFIGDLDPSVTSEMLREAFSLYGPIYKEETFVKHRNYGFVRFMHRKHAEVAKREMDGKVLGNRPIRIGWGDANYQRHCVHIQFDPSNSDVLLEADVIAKFEEFGAVASVNLPRTQQGTLRGFGFIYYEDTDEGEKSAATVISELNGTELNGVVIQCNFGKKPAIKKKRTRGGQRRGGGRFHHHPHSRGVGIMGLGVGQSSQLFPVQVMMPVGPQGTWQPVQYMMTAHQAQQFYSSVQYNPHPQHAPTSPGTDGGHQLIPMYYTYRGEERKEVSADGDGYTDNAEHQQQTAARVQEQQPTTPTYAHILAGGSSGGGAPASSNYYGQQQQQQQQQQHQPNSYSIQRQNRMQSVQPYHQQARFSQQHQPQQQQQQQPFHHTHQRTNPQQVGRYAYLPKGSAGHEGGVPSERDNNHLYSQ